MLSMLAAHAAITGGVVPAQTTSFQLFKLLDCIALDADSYDGSSNQIFLL